jgi:hypothetical protein
MISAMPPRSSPGSKSPFECDWSLALVPSCNLLINSQQGSRVVVSKTGEQGSLMFADGLLMAVITHLHAVDEQLERKWFVEACFSPDEAQR